MKLSQRQLEAHLWGAANILRGKTAEARRRAEDDRETVTKVGEELVAIFLLRERPMIEQAYLKSVLNFCFQISLFFGFSSDALPRSSLMYLGRVFP